MAIGSTNALGISGMVFNGATSVAGGRRGLVLTPQAGDEKKVLKGDGTWGEGGEELQIASESVLGGVKIGNTLSIDSVGTLDYNLPTASSSVKGGVVSSTVAGGVKVNASGAMEVNPATTWGLLKLDSVGYYTDWNEETEEI